MGDPLVAARSAASLLPELGRLERTRRRGDHIQGLRCRRGGDGEDLADVAAEATDFNTDEMSESNLLVKSFTRAARAMRSLIASASLAASSLALIMFSLKIRTALAIKPISSLLSMAGISTEWSPPANCPMAPTILRMGGTIERLVRYTTVTATPMPTPISTQSKVVRKLVSARTAAPSCFRLSCCRETIPPSCEPAAFFAPAKISSSLLARGRLHW